MARLKRPANDPAVIHERQARARQEPGSEPDQSEDSDPVLDLIDNEAAEADEIRESDPESDQVTPAPSVPVHQNVGTSNLQRMPEGLSRTLFRISGSRVSRRRTPKNRSAKCTVCDRVFCGLHQLDQHRRGRPHQIALERLQQLDTDLTCRPCGRIFKDRHDFEGHQRGRKHLRRVTAIAEKRLNF